MYHFIGVLILIIVKFYLFKNFKEDIFQYIRDLEIFDLALMIIAYFIINILFVIVWPVILVCIIFYLMAVGIKKIVGEK